MLYNLDPTSRDAPHEKGYGMAKTSQQLLDELDEARTLMRDYAEARRMCDRFQVYLTTHRYDQEVPAQYSEVLALYKALRWVVEPEACRDSDLEVYLERHHNWASRDHRELAKCDCFDTELK